MLIPRSAVRNSIRIIPFALLIFGAAACSSKKIHGYQGYVEGDFVNISSSQPGRLDCLYVARGQTIQVGSPLFFLDSDVESAALRQADQQLQAAKSQLDDIQQGRRPQEIAVIKAQLAQATANESLAETTLRREQAVFETGGISEEQLDLTRTQFELASARVTELKNQLNVAELPAREDQIKAQTASVAAAQAAYDQSEWRYNQKAVKTVSSGLVFDILYDVGEWVPAGYPVVRFLPPDKIKIRFFVPETDIANLTLGQSVQLTVDGRPDEIPAKISYISITAEYTPPIIYSDQTRSKLVFMIEALPVDPIGSKLHVGQPLSVRLS